MVSIAALARRLERAEQRRAADVPSILECDDDIDGAIERFAERYGRAPAIIVPARCSEANLEREEQRWARLQRELVADAKSERKLKEGNDDDNARHNAQSRTQQRRILSKSVAGHPAIAIVGQSRELVR